MGSTTMDGTEQVLFESTELGEYSGYIFLHRMETGDTIVIRVYIRNVEDGNYYPWLEDAFTGKQKCPAVRMEPIIGKTGIRVTAQQTAGAYRTIDHMWFKR